MNLYQINEEITNCLDAETGEFNEEKYNSLQIMKQDKLENIALWIKDLRADTDAVKAEIQVFSNRVKNNTALIERLKTLLQDTLEGEKFKTSKCSVSYRAVQSVSVNPDVKLPTEYTRVIHQEYPDKEAIKKALKSGETIDGCELVNKQAVIIK